MDRRAREMITKEAARILNEIKGGRIFGEAIDFSDYDMPLVAAYYAGRFSSPAIHLSSYCHSPYWPPVGTLMGMPVFTDDDLPMEMK